MGQSSNYYLQGNGLAESANNMFLQVLKKIIMENQRNLHKKLNNELSTSQTTLKESTCQSPYLLVYGKESMFLVNIETNALSMDY